MYRNPHIWLAFGTRPEAIKLAPVVQQLRQIRDCQTTIVCTGQHTDLLAPLVQLFELQVDRTLDVMQPGQSLNLLFSKILQATDTCLAADQPDIVVVQGDTTTAAACALAAFHRRIPVAHVEAGLRTDDPHNPFPEETNRRLISRLASIHFAATERNRQTLLQERIADRDIHVVGNPVVDSLLMFMQQKTTSPRLAGLLAETTGKRRIVLTTHRRESFGDVLEANLTTLRDFLHANADCQLIFPVHPNPRVQEAAKRILGETPRALLTEPLNYPDFLGLVRESQLVVSDSGGIQEEAPTLRTPVIILRKNTERPEAVEHGFARLAPTAADLRKALQDWQATKQHAVNLRGEAQANPFGQGDAARRIVQVLMQYLEPRTTVPDSTVRL